MEAICVTSVTLLSVLNNHEKNFGLIDFSFKNGFDFKTAINSEEILRAAQNEQPDLILLETAIKGKIDGFETCRQLKKNPQTKEIPIILILESSDVLDTALKLEVADYLIKPFRQEVMLARIKTHLTICQLQRAKNQR
ncbi:response regulator [Candidatus Parabeggiatoa sp. HSG14]|uniref:response regulator n=1 Tax=Candidatus Parabeggiatoa sp. HSG14 TaxID=3055593 RepID=UPI0032E48E9B